MIPKKKKKKGAPGDSSPKGIDFEASMRWIAPPTVARGTRGLQDGGATAIEPTNYLGHPAGQVPVDSSSFCIIPAAPESHWACPK